MSRCVCVLCKAGRSRTGWLGGGWGGGGGGGGGGGVDSTGQEVGVVLIRNIIH